MEQIGKSVDQERINHSTDLTARPARTKYHGPSIELNTIMEGGMYKLHILLYCNRKALHPGDWIYSIVATVASDNVWDESWV